MPLPENDRDLPFWLRPWAIVVFVLLILAIRFFVAAATGLVRDEGYYTLWSFWPAFGYLDHPPMIAWLVALGRTLLGDSELGVRLFPVLATAATSFAIYRTGRLLFDPRTAGLATIWFNLTIASGLLFIAAPDAPAVSFWSLSVWAVAEFMARRNANWWLLVGLFAGLALLSKYTSFFLGAGLALFLVTSRERLGWLKLWQVWAGGAVALLVFLPNALWNAERDWASFAFQGRRLTDMGLDFGGFTSNLGDLVVGQALAIGLFLFLFIVLGTLLYFARTNHPGRANLALPIFTSLPLALYFIFYCFAFRVEANWPAVIWPMLSLVGAWAAVHIRPRNLFAAAPFTLMRWAHAPLGIVLLGVIYAQALWQPFIANQALDRTRDMRGWRQLQHDVAALAEANAATWVATAGDYGLTGELAAYARFNGDVRPVHALDDRARYGFGPPFAERLALEPALFVTGAGAPPDTALAWFTEAQLLGTVERRQPNDLLERFDVFLATGLRNP